MANGNNATIGFEKQIWDAACVLWGHIPAAEYRKVIVGLIFLRYISNAFEKRYQELVAEGDGFEDDRDAYAEDNIFFVPEDARWSKIASAAHTPEIGTLIDNAMRAIEAENKSLKNVLPKNYASPDLDKRVLGDVVDLFTNMDMSDTKENKDLLGKTYQYCIQQFAAYEGVKGGEFYTPESIVKTIVAILKPYENCRVYDPCCGSGGMFVQSADFIEAHRGNRGKISVYGQESNADTWKMAKMNMAIRGIDANFGPYQADTFFNDLHPTLKADFIMANPPFNVDEVSFDRVSGDARFNTYGVPRNSTKSAKKASDKKETVPNANYLWIGYFATALNEHGKAALVMANSASDAGKSEHEIRKKMIEEGIISQMVTLPSNMFSSVTLPATLWFFDKHKPQTEKKDEILFIDARNTFTQVDRAHRKFSDEQIKNLGIITRLYQGDTEAYAALLVEYREALAAAPETAEDKETKTKAYWQAQINWLTERFPDGVYRDVIGLCKAAKLDGEDGIIDQDYSLNAGRYVGVVIEDDGMTEADFKETMLGLNAEFEALNEEAKKLEAQISLNLRGLFTNE